MSGITEAVSGVFFKPKKEEEKTETNSREADEKRLWILKGRPGGNSWEEYKEQKQLEIQLKQSHTPVVEVYKSSKQEGLSDEEISRKHSGFWRGATKGLSVSEFKEGFPEGLKIAGIEFAQPRDEWLAEKRADEEMKREGQQVYNKARMESYAELQAEKGYGKYSTKSEISKQKAAELKMLKQQKAEEYALARLEIATKRAQLGLESQRISLARQAASGQSRDNMMPGFGGGQYDIKFSPMAGLERLQGQGGIGQGWSPFAGLEKFAGQGQGQSSGPDFSRFVNPDPSAGLSKLWGPKPQQQPQKVARKIKHRKHRRK